MIRESLEYMKKIGVTLTEIEMIRTDLLKRKAEPEMFKALDRWHQLELKWLKASKRFLVAGVVLALIMFFCGISNGVMALQNWETSRWLPILNGLASLICLNYVRKEITG